VDHVPVYHIPTNDTPQEPLVFTEVVGYEPQAVYTETPNPDNIINWNTNFRDPVFIDNFTGHLQESPPICKWISEAFSVFMKYPAALIFWTFIYFVFAVFSWLPSRLMTHQSSAFVDIVAVLLQLLITVLMFTWDIVGMIFILKLLKARPDSPRDLASQFRLFCATFVEIMKNVRFLVNVVLLLLLLSVIISLGFTCLIIPGVWMAVSFCLSAFIYLEHHEDLQSIVDTLRISKNVVNKHWCGWFGFVLAISFLCLTIIFFPIGYIAYAIALRETVGLRVTQV